MSQGQKCFASVVYDYGVASFLRVPRKCTKRPDPVVLQDEEDFLMATAPHQETVPQNAADWSGEANAEKPTSQDAPNLQNRDKSRENKNNALLILFLIETHRAACEVV